MLNVFYSPNQQVDSNESFSPSAGKPAKVLANWKEHHFPISIHEPIPCDFENLCLAHDPKYVKGVLDLKITNGFGNKSPEIAESLYWTSGSLTSAAQFALVNDSHAISLTSGFHHACYDSGGGFCTFNGLIIASEFLRLNHNISAVGILDLDAHFGNGTEDIIKKKDLDYIEHYSLGAHRWDSETAEYFLEQLPYIFEKHFKNVEILLYQAGADSALLDPLGGIFTGEQMRRRDRIVFEQCKNFQIPVVFNLAGGYQDRFENVLALHRMTAEELLKVFHDIRLNTGCDEEYEELY